MISIKYLLVLQLRGPRGSGWIAIKVSESLGSFWRFWAGEGGIHFLLQLPEAPALLGLWPPPLSTKPA